MHGQKAGNPHEAGLRDCGIGRDVGFRFGRKRCDRALLRIASRESVRPIRPHFGPRGEHRGENLFPQGRVRQHVEELRRRARRKGDFDGATCRDALFRGAQGANRGVVAEEPRHEPPSGVRVARDEIYVRPLLAVLLQFHGTVVTVPDGQKN